MPGFKTVLLLCFCLAIFIVTVASSQPRWEPFPAAKTGSTTAVVVPASSTGADHAEGYGTMNAASPAAAGFSLEDVRRRAALPPEVPPAVQWVLAALTLALFASALRMLAGLARPSQA